MLIDHFLTSKVLCSSSDECSSSVDRSCSSSESSVESSSSDSDNSSSSDKVSAKKVNVHKLPPKRKIHLSKTYRHNETDQKLQPKSKISLSNKVSARIWKPNPPLRSKSTPDYIAVKDIKRKRLRSKYQEWCESRTNQSSDNKISVKPSFRHSMENYPPIPGIIINKRSLFQMRMKKHSNHPTKQMKELSKKEPVYVTNYKKRKRKRTDSYNASPHKTDKIPKHYKKKKILLKL